MIINEGLDFSFKFSDFDVVTELMDYYLDDRVYVFEEMFNGKEYTQNEVNEYIHYFITPCLENKKQHEYLSTIKRFLNREYEIFNHPSISTLVGSINGILFTEKDDYELIDDFENYETEVIDQLYELWQQLYEAISNYPLLDLDTYKNEVIDFVPVYYKEDETDTFVLNEVKRFVATMKKEYPTSLRRLDSIILCSKDYIEFVAGEGTMAYFVSSNIFMPSSVSKEDELFFTTTIFHELGHFVYDLLPIECQILWQDYYTEWCKNNVKLTRDENNSVEELFADVFSLQYNPKQPDYIHEPSKLITNIFYEIIDRGFKK